MELIFSFDTMLMTLRQQINPKQNSHMATTSARNDQRSSHKIHSLSNDRCIAANRVKQFKVLTPLLFKQPPVMIATETEMSWFRARGHRDWGLGEDRTPHLPVESHWSRIHSGYCCALRPSAIKTIHLWKRQCKRRFTWRPWLPADWQNHGQRGLQTRLHPNIYGRRVRRRLHMPQNINELVVALQEERRHIPRTSRKGGPSGQCRRRCLACLALNGSGLHTLNSIILCLPAHRPWIALSYVCRPTDTE